MSLFLPMRRPLALGMGVGRPWWLPSAPAVTVPSGGTIYVSGASPSALPAGNDTTGDGTAAKPYATLTKAMSVISAGGNRLVLCDGTFAENTGAGGRWIMAGNFTAPVLFDSYSGAAATFVISNASGTAGVVNVRGNAVGNVQIRHATIRPTTDGCPAIQFNPTGNGLASNICFFDCVIEVRTAAANAGYAVDLLTDFTISNIQVVRPIFKRTVGGSTASNPSILRCNPTTLTTSNQPYSNIGLWYGSTTDNNWARFSGLVAGVAGIDIIGCALSINGTYGVLLGQDSSGGTTPNVTTARVWGNTITTIGTSAHGLLIGENVTGADVAKNIMNSTLHGIVIKGAANTNVRNNTVTLTNSVNGSGLYAKSSIGTVFADNISIVTGAGAATAFREGVDGANKAGTTTLIQNTLSVSGASATALQWVDGAGSTGGAVSNDNSITLAGGAALGYVRGTAVATQADLRAVWAAHGLAGDAATNDSRSVVA